MSVIVQIEKYRIEIIIETDLWLANGRHQDPKNYQTHIIKCIF